MKTVFPKIIMVRKDGGVDLEEAKAIMLSGIVSQKKVCVLMDKRNAC
jgi:hypothetical protein